MWRVLLAAAAGTLANACTTPSSAVSAAETRPVDHNVYHCVPFGAMTHAEVLVNDQCIGTVSYHGWSDDRCYTRPWVEEANANRSKSEISPRPLNASIELHFPERFQCSIWSDASSARRELHRQSFAFHPAYFPGPEVRRERPFKESPFKAVPDEQGWSFVFEGTKVMRIERSAAAASTANISWHGSIGAYSVAGILCLRGIGRHLRTLCHDPMKSVYKAGMTCSASALLEGENTSEGGPYFLPIGYASVEFEAVRKTADDSPDARYLRQTGRAPPNCAPE